MKKYQRIERLLAGEAISPTPVMLCRHWPGDDQRASDLARATLEFQQAYDWDCLALTPSVHYGATGYGLQDAWQGDTSGQRSTTKRVIQRSLDWTELRTQDPERGETGKVLEALRLLLAGLQPDDAAHADANATIATHNAPPVLLTVYSPLTQAMQLAGHELLLRNLRTHPDRLETGLNTLTESTLRLIEALRRIPLAGLLYVADLADYTQLSEAEYEDFGVPYDLKILESLPQRLWLNMLRVGRSDPMLKTLANYPVQIVNWADAYDRPNLERGRALWAGVVCGGVDVQQHLHYGTPAEIRAAVRDAVRQTDGRRLMISTGDVIPLTTPTSNIRALRDAVGKARV